MDVPAQWWDVYDQSAKLFDSSSVVLYIVGVDRHFQDSQQF